DHPSWSSLPRVVFRWGTEGYEIGLEVQDDWWEKLCKSGELKELANTKKYRNQLCGTTRLAVATLPYSEFAVYYRPVDYAQQGKLQAEWDKQLSAKGWKRSEEDRDADIRDPWLRVEHKYFTVAHRSI